MNLSTLDYIVIFSFFALTLLVGFAVSKQSGKNSSEYFLSGRSMPWWLLGISMVATTFAVDTPLLVTDFVRNVGVSGNWGWWVFLLTGMLTVFVYAKLWRRSDVATDIEFYELRYSGKAAKFLRAFRALYLGLIFNILVMSVVTLAAIKIGEVMLGVPKYVTVGVAGLVTLVFSSVGGFKGVIYTDFILFVISMIGAVWAAVYIVNLDQVGGLTELVTNPAVIEKMSILPDFSNTELMMTLLVIPLAVQWWSAWYPGAEPGGGGYVAQRMLAAKNESHAIGATFLFNILHYAMRPWPWILVALASIVVFPDLQSLHTAFPAISQDKLAHDLAYPAMLTFLPSGLLGLVMASMIAAYMSTVSTHLNWGSSYIVNDFYIQHINKDATEKEKVNVGRLSAVVMMVFSSILAFFFTNAQQVFNVIIMFGAGTGLIFILRWFWWRINAWSEIAAMFVSGFVSIFFTFVYFPDSIPSYWQFPIVVAITTLTWIAVTFLTKPEKKETLYSFYNQVQPGGSGWKKVLEDADKDGVEIVGRNKKSSIPNGILAMILGCLLIYSLLFSVGNLVYMNFTTGLILLGASIIFAVLLIQLWKRIKNDVL
ncbi:Na+/proline symporter [Pustulibacterium marinum]|uniref:Na+/proline symporter n=1 Tax=Pustulibacterium marinum TaxID=1224947 RepID=A0A1I7G413_9FLAO|nr:sodium:solute symporter family protein [Pustulibacterium marinum]SFU43215.1 Na+/proline symporter [Pustulibacterium marinum]